MVYDCVADTKGEACDQQKGVDDYTSSKTGAHGIHKEKVEVCTYRNEVLNNAILNDSKYQYACKQCFKHAGAAWLSRFPEIVNHRQCGNGEQIKQVYADRQAHHVSNEQKPAVRCRIIGYGFPLQHGPEDNGREQG